jgi:hypothetical protein
MKLSPGLVLPDKQKIGVSGAFYQNHLLAKGVKKESHEYSHT